MRELADVMEKEKPRKRNSSKKIIYVASIFPRKM